MHRLKYRYAITGFALAAAYLCLLFLLHYLISEGTPAGLLRDSPAAVITVLLSLPLCLLAGYLLGSERDRREAARLMDERERDHLEMAEKMSLLLHRAEESRRMAAIAAREIKHPLTSIIGYALTLVQYWDKLDERERRDFLGYIRVSASRLEGMINDLMRILELARESVPPEGVRLDFSEVLSEVASLLQGVHEERGVTLSLRFLEELPALRGDPSRLFDLLYNLLDIALRCSQDGKMVSAWCSRRDNRVALHVRCPNLALPPEKASAIERWPPAESEGEMATLVMEYRLASHLAREAGGTLRMDLSVKAGLSFYLALPLEPAE
jgi:signal transduction histidine kinase